MNSDMPSTDERSVFLFQGQGGFHKSLMRALYQRNPRVRARFDIANNVCCQHIGASLLDLLHDAKPIDPDVTNDLEQIGIYVEGCVLAAMLGAPTKAAVVMGHSFGEFAALAVSGTVTFEDGLYLVCERVKALRPLRGCGRMLALGATPEQVQSLLDLQPATATISVVNHAMQTVVSGPENELDALRAACSARDISATLLPSRYPFHSSLLQSAVERFRNAAGAIMYQDPAIPLFLPVEERYYDVSIDMADLLARHLVTAFNFAKPIKWLHEQGHTRFTECAASSTLRNLVRRILPNERVILEGPEEMMKTDPSEPAFEAMAIVGYGCVVPGALDAREFWDRLLDGRSGVVGCDSIDPHFADFYAEGGVTPNRTYSKLMGYVEDSRLEEKFRATGLDQNKRYAKVQKIAAVALRESVDRFSAGRGEPQWRNAVCYFGATPDGIKEYDDAIALERFAADLDEKQAQAVRECFGTGASDPVRFLPRCAYRTAVHDVLGSPVQTVLVDTACSSSLYALDFGIKALAMRQADVAICMGAFASGIGNNCLFAQFKGLATKALKAFDAHAEGTVFGEGAAAVIVKRLVDAIADGDPIYGVIRGVGLSSDGKSAAVNVPTVMGQRLAIERAYASSQTDIDTIQYVEGHATGTAGDVIEFQSLSGAFAARDSQVGRVSLGSVKSLISHTGWASGLASLIKILLSFEAKVMPPQHGLEDIHPNINVDASCFTFLREAQEWPTNVLGVPRRAGINSFGFGGTNVHVIAEAYDEQYHRSLARVDRTKATPPDAAVVAVNSILPAANFDRTTLTLPQGLRLLPDVLDAMSSEQLLALMGASEIVGHLKSKNVDLARVAVVISGYSKCELARIANDFIYEKRLKRIAEETGADAGAFHDNVRKRNRVPGPYTLAGVMPNVISGRVAQMFNLNGPNVVIGESDGYDGEFIEIAKRYIAFGDADAVICGALNLEDIAPPSNRRRREGLVLFCIMSLEFAKTHALDILHTLDDSSVQETVTAA